MRAGFLIRSFDRAVSKISDCTEEDEDGSKDSDADIRSGALSDCLAFEATLTRVAGIGSEDSASGKGRSCDTRAKKSYKVAGFSTLYTSTEHLGESCFETGTVC